MLETKSKLKNHIMVGKEKFIPFLAEDEIQKRIEELAHQLSEEYRGKVPVLIGVLNGSFLFMSDLIRYINIDCEIDFFKLSSYGDAKISSGRVKMLKELNCDVTGRDIIIVEDIVDSGLSINYIEELFSEKKPTKKTMLFA